MELINIIRMELASKLRASLVNGFFKIFILQPKGLPKMSFVGDKI